MTIFSTVLYCTYFFSSYFLIRCEWMWLCEFILYSAFETS